MHTYCAVAISQGEFPCVIMIFNVYRYFSLGIQSHTSDYFIHILFEGILK